jgi:hypothetical protein
MKRYLEGEIGVNAKIVTGKSAEAERRGPSLVLIVRNEENCCSEWLMQWLHG